MERRTWVIVGCCLLLVVAAFGFYKLTRPRQTDRELIQELVEGGKRAVETKDMRRCLSYVHPQYTDNDRNSRRSIENLMRAAFRESRTIDIYLASVDILSLQPPDAVVQVVGTVTFTDKYESRHQDSLNLTLSLVKERGRWRVIRAGGVPTAVETN